MHLDEYMARRGIRADDTVVVDNPCAVFDGNVEKPGEGSSADAKRRLEDAEAALRGLLD